MKKNEKKCLIMTIRPSVENVTLGSAVNTSRTHHVNALGHDSTQILAHATALQA